MTLFIFQERSLRIVSRCQRDSRSRGERILTAGIPLTAGLNVLRIKIRTQRRDWAYASESEREAFCRDLEEVCPMKRNVIRTLLPCLIVLGLVFSQVAFGEKVEREVTVAPGNPLSYVGQDRISFMAARVLKHIAIARGYIHEKNARDAREEIDKALKLIEIIRAALPTTKIKDHIWVAKKHLSYEDTEEVIPDLVPIYVSLDAVQDFIPVEDVRDHVDKARKALEDQDKKRGQEELDLAVQGLVYEEIDIPLNATEEKISEAERLLAEGKEKEADMALNQAEEGVQVISLATYEPMLLAERSLWQATKYYVRGKYEASRRALSDAKAYLKQAAEKADKKTKVAIAKLNEKIDDLSKKVEKGGSDLSKEMKELWGKTKTLFNKTIEKFK